MPRGAWWSRWPTTPWTRSGYCCRVRSWRALRRRWRACATQWSASRNGSNGLGRLVRLLRIFAIGLRFGLLEFVPSHSKIRLLRPFALRSREPRGQRLREALETLGPIYVKFVQVLSTRRDLVPLDIAD